MGGGREGRGAGSTNRNLTTAANYIQYQTDYHIQCMDLTVYRLHTNYLPTYWPHTGTTPVVMRNSKLGSAPKV